MALITCPDCRAQISDRATHCLQCGGPVPSMPSAAVRSENDNRMAWAGILLIGCLAIPPLGYLAITNDLIHVRGQTLSADDAASHVTEVALGMVSLFLTLYVYFYPSMVAKRRGQPNLTAIRALNLLAGWTFLGWVVALVWAYSGSCGRRK